MGYLASKGVQVLIAGGRGMRPLQGFHQAGIAVYHGAGAPTVGAALNAFVKDILTQFQPEFACTGCS